MATTSETTLWNQWCCNANRWPEREAIVHWSIEGDPVRWNWANLISRARYYGHRLYQQGIRRGEVCALIIRHNSDFYPLYMGIVAIGAIPAVLAYPNPRLHPEKFKIGLLGMAAQSGLDWILTEKSLAEQIRSLVLNEQTTIRDVLEPLEELEPVHFSDLPAVTASPQDTCLLQHSSGTTGLQKAVALSHQAVMTHLENYGSSIALGRDDRIVSWLPLYHDMGLIAAFHLPLFFAIPVIQLDPFEWVMAPSILWNVVHEEGASLTWLPNFSYNILADRTRYEDMEGLSLHTLRMLINCSEPIRKESHQKFLDRFTQYGIQPENLSTCYAMAETVFAVTQSLPNQIPTVLSADRNVLSQGRFVPAGADSPVRYCVSSGMVIPGCFIQVRDEKGDCKGDDEVGELFVASESLFEGYRNRPDLTSLVLINGWCATGDYGFMHEGECYIIGRKKDIIIMAGKNIYPEDIEDAASGIKGILPGRVIAFGYYDAELGTERAAIIAETECKEQAALEQLAMQIVEKVMMLDITVSRIYLVIPRWLIKSSSGKPSRSTNRARVLDQAAKTEGILFFQGLHQGGEKDDY